MRTISRHNNNEIPLISSSKDYISRSAILRSTRLPREFRVPLYVTRYFLVSYYNILSGSNILLCPCLLEDYMNCVSGRLLPDYSDIGDGYHRPEAAVYYNRK
jgi:hypothetical protein